MSPSDNTIWQVVTGSEGKLVRAGEDINVPLPPEAIRTIVSDLRSTVDTYHWDVGLLLRAISKEELWKEWGYESFKEYCETEVTWKMRRCWYLIQIVEAFTDKVPVARDRIAGIGVSKAWLLAQLVDLGVMTTKNWEEWVIRAEALPWRELDARLKELRESSGGGGGEGGEGGVENLSTLSFRCYPPQKAVIDEALEAAGGICKKEGRETEHQGRLLELVCLEFLSNHPSTKKEAVDRIIRSVQDAYDIALSITGGADVAVSPSSEGEEDG